MAKQTFTTGQVLTAAQMTSLQQTAMLGGAANAKVASYVLVAADAGDAITMSNAGATTITVNTGLFAAGDIVTIINIGAGACTITAGTATVTTSGSLVLAQNQGGVLRFTSASAAIFLQFATPASGDIEGVTAGTGISGGGTSGTVTITNSMATEIAAKGDLIVGTGSATFDNLTVGANNTVLTADSSTATGLKWAASAGGSSYVAGKNALFNSAYDIWQRGTSSIGTAYNYTADRWLNFRDGFAAGATFSRIASTQAGFRYALRAQRDSGNTGTGQLHLRQGLETVDSLRFQGQTVTLSFYARAGANFSAASSILVSTIYQGEGTDQPTDNMTGWTTVTAIPQNNTLTTSWQRFSQTVTISTAKTQLGIAITYTPTGTAGAADNFDITGVQLEIASTASEFSRQTGSFASELYSCQRYFYIMGNNGVSYEVFTSNGIAGDGAYYGPTVTNLWFQMPQPMRVTPTFSQVGSFSMRHGSASTGVGITAWGASGSTLSPQSVWTTATLAFAVAGAGSNLTANNDGTARLLFSAEL